MLDQLPQSTEVNADFPEKFGELFTPSRYKESHGGRGGARSWSFARALLIKGTQEKLRILCCRELQKSIKDSVHKLLKEQISLMGLEAHYQVLQSEIRGTNGTEFLFYGLKTHVSELKSIEGVDIAWVEEAHNVRKTSWEILIPTIRKDGSEIWVSFNVQLESDETYQRFIKHPPPNCIHIESSWRDNPWFPKELMAEMLHLKVVDPDAWLNVWEGKPRKNLAGAVYAKQLRKVWEDERVLGPSAGGVRFEPLRPIDTFWDLGRADATAVWFAQWMNFQVRVGRYMEAQGEDLDFYFKELAKLPYLWGTMWLPHDARSRRLGQKKSVQQQFIDAGFRTRIVPNITVSQGISHARAFMEKCWFDETLCADGLQALGHYRFEVIEGTNTFSDTPLHDWASHGADAFRYMALALRDPKAKEAGRTGLRGAMSKAAAAMPNLGWMK